MLGLPDQNKILTTVAESVDATRSLAKAINSLAEATNRQTDVLAAERSRQSLKSQPGGW